jgi:hypothetical protein
MNTRYDEKGKFFTDLITKDAVPAVIQTITHRIVGKVYLRPEERLIDAVNRAEQYLAVTDAVIYDGNGSAVYHANFVTINRHHIIWIIPDAEIVGKIADPGGDS